MTKAQKIKFKKTAENIVKFRENNFDVQKLQDKIFKKMSADKKIEIATQLWQLGKELNSKHFNYGTNRSKTSFN